MSTRKYILPQPHRVRRIEKSFAWIDHRLLRHGHLAAMTHQDHSLYLFLVLAADRQGVSFYRKEKICDALGLDFTAFEVARDRLISMGLIAFAPYSITSPNGFYQVLPIEGHTAEAQRPAGSEPTAAAKQVQGWVDQLAERFSANSA